jgi:hypothetical protein
MTRTPRHGLGLLAAGVVLVVAGLAVPFTPALAADPNPDQTSTTSVGVTVPAATPTPTPSTSNPPAQDPPGGGSPGAGSPGAGSSGTGGQGGGGSGSGGSGSGGAAPASQASGPATATEPTIGKTPSTTAEKATVDRTAYNAGDAITVSFGGFTPNEKVQVVLYSDPILIGNFPADANGTLTQSFQLPKDLPAGSHTVQLTGWESKKVATASIVVAAAASSAAPAVQGVPVWAWWLGGALLALLLGAGTWWLIRTMRAPAEVTAA